MPKPRITTKDLGVLLGKLNAHVGKDSFDIGGYSIDCAYGGVKLVQRLSSGGSEKTISTDGYGTMRQLHDFLQAYLAGMDADK